MENFKEENMKGVGSGYTLINMAIFSNFFSYQYPKIFIAITTAIIRITTDTAR